MSYSRVQNENNQKITQFESIKAVRSEYRSLKSVVSMNEMVP